MDYPYYLTPDGRELHKAETSMHHAIFERCAYKTPTEKKFREMGGMTIRLGNHQHKELHAHVPPPPKPNPDLMRDIYLHGRRTPYEGYVDLFGQIVEYVALVALGGSQHAEEAHKLHENLVAQQHFIDQGAVVMVRKAA